MTDIDALIARLQNCAHYARNGIVPLAETIEEGVAALRTLHVELDALRNMLGQLRDMACRSADRTLPDRIIKAIDAALARLGEVKPPD